MKLALVIGQVVSTVKESGLATHRLLLLSDWPEIPDGTSPRQSYVAVDHVGAGDGEVVLVTTGSAARIGGDAELVPTDCAVVGIVDSVSHSGTVTYTTS
ncbi:EutN/CcmL family microcompartment protein [Ornithinicoccus hortensis]|uniref:Ethanolamine utilization protein EutN n=1 Tax=Ornithinicoccus hortensis TaxID=82346 RepID=A0A542YTG9_9MICO|nr:EutN/CcmL family microcompartment protein [Ornithinicoccus hortensis]TQL51347.1 ethanolamine utilization protein EutN [Ornithinicoccus hortensis]